MKKTINSLLAIAVAAFAFMACSDIPEPEGYNQKIGDGLITYVPEGTGTATDPYNVAGLLQFVNDMKPGAITPTDIYTRGFVSEIDDEDFNPSYGNITYFITDNQEGKSKKFEVYRGLGLKGEKFTSLDDLKVGDAVIICGKVKNHNGVLEYDQGSYLTKLNDKDGTVTPPDPPTGDKLTPGKYFMVYKDGESYQVAKPISDTSKGFGYIYTEAATVTDGKLVANAANLFTFEEIATDQFSIKDANNIYYYTDTSHKSFQLSATAPTDFYWSVVVGTDKVTITSSVADFHIIHTLYNTTHEMIPSNKGDDIILVKEDGSFLK